MLYITALWRSGGARVCGLAAARVHPPVWAAQRGGGGHVPGQRGPRAARGPARGVAQHVRCHREAGEA